MLGPLFKPYRFVFVLSLAKPTNNRKKNIIPPSEQTAWIWIFLMKFESFTPAEVTEEAIGMAQVAFHIPMDRRLKKQMEEVCAELE